MSSLFHYNSEKRRRKRSYTFGAFVMVAGSLFGYIAYTALHEGVDVEKTIKDYYTLHEAFLQGGIATFLKSKQNLYEQTSKAIHSNKDEEKRQAATNIALYLFPELLPKTNFERSVAKQQWVPMQKEIEGHPNSRESRKQFQEMRANIWNYENPDRQNPTLSSQAKQVIRIYDSLSRYSKD